MNPITHAVTPLTSLDDAERRQVAALEASCLRADGVSPLNDQVRLDLGRGGLSEVRHLLATTASGEVTGYAHLRWADGAPVSAHLAVDPAHRRQGVGTALARRAIGDVAPEPLRVWAHGDGNAAAALAGELGFRRARELWQMRRPLDVSLPEATYPDDVVVRTFEMGRDEQAWVRVNQDAFATHPEQGQLTVADVRQRTQQPWFDPAGFFLAERADDLLGFHWTKVHPAGEMSELPIGEVYAVGVAPRAQGLGLGKALTATGLLHLRERGLSQVLLYVEADNAAGVALYNRLGFTRYAADVMYQHP